MINININMIAERRSKRIREMNILRISALLVVCITILLVMMNAINGYDALIASKRLETVNMELKRQAPRLKQWNATQQQIKAKRPVVKLLKQVQNSECAWMTVFADLSKITPPDVVLTTQSCSGSEKGMTLVLSGKVADEPTLARYMIAFSQNTTWAGQPTIKTFTASTGEKDPRMHYNFSLDIPIHGLVGGEF